MAAKLWRGSSARAVWGLGALVAGGMAAGLLLSRTVGLPGVLGFAAVREEGVWGPLETASLFLELAFLALAWLEWSRHRAESDEGRSLIASAAGAESSGLSRRGVLAALVPLVGAGAAGRLLGGPSFGLGTASAAGHDAAGRAGASSGGLAAAHGGGASGPTFKRGDVVDHVANGFNPTDILRDFDMGKSHRLASGRTLREWELVAEDKEIEVAPGVKYPAWTYNGRVPGPTLRAREGERLRVKFVNGGSAPHTIHFHGIHTAVHDGVPGVGPGLIEPGGSYTYEFDAEPFGLHHYHCHAGPLAEHIARGLYGTFVIDPETGRPEADELVMQMNGFNTNFDAEGNQVYAVNTVAFHHVNEPIKVKRGELVRIYLVNILEFDPINSLHIHGNFFDYYPTGTSLEPAELTDTIMLGQGQRGICELRFPYPGMYMFHAHKSEFAELGWMGFFDVS